MIPVETVDFKPEFDDQLRELHFGGFVVKRFKHQAGNQIQVLKTFQEDGWPRRIDDPLPANEVDPKRRIIDTVKSLNRSHLSENLIRFRSDGTGEGIIWDQIKS